MMLTERLLLRRFETSDLSDLYEYLSDGRVVKYEPYPPVSEDQCKERLEHFIDSKDFWAVCLRDGGKVIGQVYLAEHTWKGYDRYEHHITI